MIDWIRDGKVDGIDLAITSAMIDDDVGDKPTGGCGCCGTTVAMFLIGIILPVIVFVVH